MTDKTPPKPAAPTPPGDRIAKVLSRAGIASRREAERMIAAGRVSVNGAVIDSPALNVTGKDQITVDGKPVSEPEPARLWLFHKPPGLVTTARDEQGRATIFDDLPEDMPRVMSTTSARVSLEPGPSCSTRSRVRQASSTGSAVNSTSPRGAPASCRQRT